MKRDAPEEALVKEGKKPKAPKGVKKGKKSKDVEIEIMIKGEDGILTKY